MARYRDPVCKLCRREGMKLFLKGDRCFSANCAIEKRNYAPGMHGQRRTKVSDYCRQLREKQKMRRIYGVLETQFRKYFRLAERQSGITGENLVRILEQRLDSVVHRLGFAASRAQARLLITHGHIIVNGRKTDIASYRVRPGDIIEVRPKSREMSAIQAALEGAKRRGLPSWLELDATNMKGTVRSMPSREEIAIPVEEQLIVALYSK
ncbi:MAG: 30S ribosomal protein S4 [Candidatus Methylomirabilota bacterium]|nr:30S ribosomal protein S4 [Candidatus Methylomirabilis sp.]NJD69709.1 30S ribosomal protein S4 [candidate division NC10 bacterium]PWB44328.1 MAG: 30S ribosomal protein S4 [candidate division NC10 bacterium]